MNDVSDQRLFDACAYCGTPFEVGVRYPVSVCEDEDGSIEIFSFCDETCQQSWDTDQ